MKAKAAVLWGQGQDWAIEDLQVDAPKAGEVLVDWKVAGLCHSDDHMKTGDMVPPKEAWAFMGIEDFYPIIGGHEGAGIVLEVGDGVTTLKPGDHVSASFVPSCGRCRYCVTGRQNLCNNTGNTFTGGMITDGTDRHFVKGKPITLMAKVGTFATHTCVSELSLDQGRRRPAARVRRARQLRRRHRMGLGRQPRRDAARRHGRRRRLRRHRHERGPGRQDGRRQAHHRRRPGRVQAGEGDGVRRHPRVRARWPRRWPRCRS